MSAAVPTYATTKQYIDENYKPAQRSRMLARLLENQTLDTWMTHELMKDAIVWVQDKKPFDVQVTLDTKIQTRDQQSSTTADYLKLKGQPVDSFFNFHSIRVAGIGVAQIRHRNRPDGMFLMRVTSAEQGGGEMVLFYEGDVHGKDDGKTQTSGCKNSHKMYQAIAQAQSKNYDMSGCVIFAAMQYSPVDQLMLFIDDMFKAHIFVCFAIADWNVHARRSGRVTTLIDKLFGASLLKHDIKYDFVFGINIGHEAGVAGYNDVEFTHRITTMLRALGQMNSNIQPHANIARKADSISKTFDIGLVRISICAIPRPQQNILETANIRSPMFIYPHQMRCKVQVNNGIVTVGANAFNNVLTFNGNLAALPNLCFKKHMMCMTSVSTNNVPPPANGCLLSETTGFFYVALPLAYYTIQQFEFVSAEMNYSWSPTKYDVRNMLRNFKANQENLTGDLQTTMFHEDTGSLFHTICASVNHLPKLSDDFELFLEECCRWRESTDESVPKYSSPKLIFRTLGIFSLQNAIDFACDIKANPNKTYLSLLASYPAGAQILVQQCMKKLSDNEAYAYIGREREVVANTAQTTDDPDSDEDIDKSGTLAKTFLAVQTAIRTQIYHSVWKVTWEAKVQDTSAAAAGPRPEVLAEALMRNYQKSVVQWEFEAIQIEQIDDADPEGVEKCSAALSDIFTPRIVGLALTDGKISLKIAVDAKLYVSKTYSLICIPEDVGYHVKYLCTPRLPARLKLPSDEADVRTEDLGKKCKACWGNHEFTFELQSRGVQESAMQNATTMLQRVAESMRAWLLDPGSTRPANWLELMIAAKEEVQRQNTEGGNAARSDVSMRVPIPVIPRPEEHLGDGAAD